MPPTIITPAAAWPLSTSEAGDVAPQMCEEEAIAPVVGSSSTAEPSAARVKKLQKATGATAKAAQRALTAFTRSDIAGQALYVAGLTTTKGTSEMLRAARQFKVPPGAAASLREISGADLAHCKRALQLREGDERASARLLGRFTAVEGQFACGAPAASVGTASPSESAQSSVIRMFDNHLIGAHVVAPRTGYTHHGIYVGDGRVVHYSGLADGLSSGPVNEVSFDEFAGGAEVEVAIHPRRKFTPEEVVRRARSRIGEALYCIATNNCEHFCNWCIEDKHHSPQVRRAAIGIGGTALASSGLASSIAVPAVAAAVLINSTILADDSGLSSDERRARARGRAGAYAGGVATSVGMVSSAGVPGLSAAGITSGLATIGGSVGGGMTAGVAVTAAAPVAAAAVVGVGIYRLVKWLRG